MMRRNVLPSVPRPAMCSSLSSVIMPNASRRMSYPLRIYSRLLAMPRQQYLMGRPARGSRPRQAKNVVSMMFDTTWSLNCVPKNSRRSPTTMSDTVITALARSMASCVSWRAHWWRVHPSPYSLRNIIPGICSVMMYGTPCLRLMAIAATPAHCEQWAWMMSGWPYSATYSS